MAFASNLTALGDAMPWVAEQLEAQSGGKVDLRVFEPGKMIPALGVFDAVSEGKVEAGYTWMGYEIGKVPASALFGAVPFGMEPWEYAAWFYFGGGRSSCTRSIGHTTFTRSSAARSAPRRPAGSASRSPRSTRSKGSSSAPPASVARSGRSSARR
jgi:TRAP-type mannitol/chloroaromatic compound transport system substrate-binding protein